MEQARTMLPMSIDELERTCLPLEQATMLPGAAFTDPRVLAWELESVFQGGWVFVGQARRLAERGDFVMVDIGSESAVVVARDDGEPRAFSNTCRHRGARLVDQPEGRIGRLQCPYHAWSYGLDGSLSNAPFTEGLEGFDRSCFGLHPVRTAVLEGLVFADLSGEAPPIEEHVGDLVPLLARHRVPGLRRAERISYEVAANWKAIGENYSECLHCPGVHPELNRLSHYRSGELIEGAGAWCGGSMTLRDGAGTMAREGGAGNGRPAIQGIEGNAAGSVLYFALFPNALVSLHPDYVMLHTLWPRAADRTEVICEWFFEPSTIAAEGFDPSDAIEFWDQVNREDWHVCELTQKGVRTRGYVPGRYSTEEVDVHEFDRMVAERYMEALREPREVVR